MKKMAKMAGIVLAVGFIVYLLLVFHDQAVTMIQSFWNWIVSAFWWCYDQLGKLR